MIKLQSWQSSLNQSKSAKKHVFRWQKGILIQSLYIIYHLNCECAQQTNQKGKKSVNCQ